MSQRQRWLREKVFDEKIEKWSCRNISIYQDVLRHETTSEMKILMNSEKWMMKAGEQKQDSASRTYLKHLGGTSFPTEYGNCYKCVWIKSEPPWVADVLSVSSWSRSQRNGHFRVQRGRRVTVGEEAEWGGVKISCLVSCNMSRAGN